jgi:hypothetical protein
MLHYLLGSKVLRPLDKQPNCKYFITPIGASSPYQILDGGSLNVMAVNC